MLRRVFCFSRAESSINSFTLRFASRTYLPDHCSSMANVSTGINAGISDVSAPTMQARTVGPAQPTASIGWALSLNTQQGHQPQGVATTMGKVANPNAVSPKADDAYQWYFAALNQARAQGFAHEPLSGDAAQWADEIGDDNIVTQEYMHAFVARLLANDELSGTEYLP